MPPFPLRVPSAGVCQLLLKHCRLLLEVMLLTSIVTLCRRFGVQYHALYLLPIEITSELQFRADIADKPDIKLQKNQLRVSEWATAGGAGNLPIKSLTF